MSKRNIYPGPILHPPVEGDWVRVPRVPTNEMLLALSKHWDSVGSKTMEDNYYSMLAIAPTPPADKQDGWAIEIKRDRDGYWGVWAVKEGNSVWIDSTSPP
jgi:hypothetical protein